MRPGQTPSGEERVGHEHPALGTFERVEILHHGPRARVTRLFLDGYTVIRKEPLGSDARSRLASETAMLQRLHGVVGVVQLRDAPPYPGSLVLEDTRGQSLAELTRPLPVGELIPLAIGVTRAVAEVHARGVMHQDISPSNILRSDDGTALLIDFALATGSGTLRGESTTPADIAGTLPYVAPERTGRTRRSVDQRADLYALGATLYELATGQPPFGLGDPLRVIHDHLTRVPAPPRTVTPNLPAAFSDIIMHLLEKEPDSRYQTAEGVIYDLERVPTSGGQIPSGPARVGEHDVQPRLGLSSRLVGRQEELAALRAALDEASAARCSGVLISGAAGVPNMLPYRVGTPAAFGFVEWNGRSLTDNAPDVMFSIAANTPVSLGIGKESITSKPRAFFPYVPVAVREPAAA